MKIIIGCIILVVIAVIFGIYKIGGSDNKSVMNKDSENAILQTISGKDFANKWMELKSSGAELIDVRTIAEYNAGHYQGAKMIDFYSADFREQLDKLNKDTQYFIYCRSGSRSGQTLKIMQELGFTKVYNLNGGFVGNGPIISIITK